MHRKFWHQTLQHILTSPAAFVTNQLLNVPKKSVASLYLKIALTFFLSGLLHTVADVSGGMPLKESGTTPFFLTQVIGLIIEDCAIGTYDRLRGPSGSENRWRPRLARLGGYVWVATFLCWSAPAWIYPIAARDSTARRLPFLPLSLFHYSA